MYVVDLVPLKHRCKQAHIRDYTKKPHMHWTLSSVVQAWKFILNGLFIWIAQEWPLLPSKCSQFYAIPNQPQTSDRLNVRVWLSHNWGCVPVCLLHGGVFHGLFTLGFFPLSSPRSHHMPIPWWTGECCDGVYSWERGPCLFQTTISSEAEPDFLQTYSLHVEAQHVVCELRQWEACVCSLSWTTNSGFMWNRLVIWT
jgi:hypothetical protein